MLTQPELALPNLDRLREITKLQTDPQKRRQGHARWLMCEVCVEADQHGMVLMLTPEPFGDGTLDADQLMLFYRRFGFREIPEPRRSDDHGSGAAMKEAFLAQLAIVENWAGLGRELWKTTWHKPEGSEDIHSQIDALRKLVDERREIEQAKLIEIGRVTYQTIKNVNTIG